MNTHEHGAEAAAEVVDDIIIEAKNVAKLYGSNKTAAIKLLTKGAGKSEVYQKTGVTSALWDVNFQVKRGEIFVIIGLSGSGKSTLIRCLNMLNRPTSGSIFFDKTDLFQLNKKELIDFRRNKVAMVFQNFGLMNHRDVLGNVAYGLEVRKIPRAEREQRAMKMIEMVGLGGLERQQIYTLSGGMRQRVGIARALTSDPEVMLMDEPFSALDPLVRSDMQFELLSIQRKLGKTIIFITHDINEAFKLGDRVAIMRDGKIIQIDVPEHMSANPADDYVEKFIEGVDKTKVFSVKHVMVKPACIVRTKDSPDYAINLMRRNETSSAYVVDNTMLFSGIVTIDAAIRARNSGESIAHVMIVDTPTIAQDALISDILPIAAEARFPLAVVDEENRLKGIVSRASVLSSLI